MVRRHGGEVQVLENGDPYLLRHGGAVQWGPIFKTWSVGPGLRKRGQLFSKTWLWTRSDLVVDPVGGVHVLENVTHIF